MDGWSYIILVVGALVIGLVAQAFLRGRVGYEGIATAVGAFIGGYLPSEYSLAGLGQWGTKFHDLYVFPTLIGALLVAVIVEVVIYYVSQPARA